MLRLDDVARAQPTMILFSKDSQVDGDKHEAATNLHDMQCLWYHAFRVEIWRVFGKTRFRGKQERP